MRTNEPSRFTFRVLASVEALEDDPFRDVAEHANELAPLGETERRAIIQSRVGQGRFRRDVLDLWGGCAVTSVTDTRVLKASHVKPWRDALNEERLDPNNGLALIPNLDALFDCGLITFDSAGLLQVSDRIDAGELTKLGIEDGMRLRRMSDRLEQYLQYHRQYVFQGLRHGDWGLLDQKGKSNG
jgi:predicted restriction endonuclease